jgi:cellulose synthase (UDP-forming)
LSTVWNLLAGPLWPGLMVGGLALTFLPWLNSENRRGRVVVIGVALLLIFRYVSWRLFYTLPPLAPSMDFLVGVAFGLIEALTIIGTSITLVILARTRSRSRDADVGQNWLLRQRYPLVDVFICTYNEEQSILDTTIIAAMGMRYPNFRVWVLDDGDRTWLEALCTRRGCQYLRRSDNTHAKAGNINNALMHVIGLPIAPSFVAILDADFAPMAEFLSRALSLFQDPSIGVVQTPQHFSNPDPIQSNLLVDRVFPDEQRYFFDVLMPARDAWGMAFCCGTSSVSRVSALLEIGGVPTQSVTEDYLLTLRLEEAGYHTVYLNERLSAGLAPEGLKEYATQRTRWCLGLMQICRGRYSPFRAGNALSLHHRIGLLESFLYWAASYPFRLLCIIVPILYWVFGIRAVNADLGDAISNYLPYFIGQTVTTVWLNGGRCCPSWLKPVS